MIKINMGCGKRNFGKEWIHIDKSKYDHIDHDDIHNFPYNNVDLIYASHLISYFNLNEIRELLIAWQKKLKKNGILRLAVPDFEKMAYLYFKKKINLSFFLGPLYGKMISADQTIYHKICFDKYSLTKLLKDLGYRNIREWDHKSVDHGVFDDHSQAYIPHMDKVNGVLISLNLECKK